MKMRWRTSTRKLLLSRLCH